MENDDSTPRPSSVPTSIDKALEVCEVLAGQPRGAALSDLARTLRQPASTVHRLLAVLKRRGYVRQDEETQRYILTLKMLDLSFKALGRSEVRLHAYPIVREYVLNTSQRGFVAIPAVGEVTYLWRSGPDEVAMYTAYGRTMPSHCALYFSPRQATRRLSCLKMVSRADVEVPERAVLRLGPPAAPGDAAQRLTCACAPVRDYTGQEVARVGLFSHGPDEGTMLSEHHRVWDLARRVSVRLGWLSPLESTA